MAWCGNVCVCAVRADAGRVGRAQRELDARGRAHSGCERPAAPLYAQCVRHPGP